MNDNDILKKIEELDLQIKDLKQLLNEKETFPKKGGTYYFVNANCTIVDNIWNEDDIECELLYSNNCFKTRERAEEVAEKIKLLLLLERGHDEYCPDFKPYFEGPGLNKNYVVYYDYASHKWRYDYFSKITNKHDVYFDSEESAQKMCNMLNNIDGEYRKMGEVEK